MTIIRKNHSLFTTGVQANLEYWYLIQEFAEVRWYQPNSNIIPKKELYFVKNGTVQLDLSFCDRRKPLSITSENTIFGEIELFSLDSEFSLSARTISPATILVWDQDLIQKLMTINPSLSFLLLQSLLNKMRLLNSQAEAITQLSIDQRFKALFIHLANHLGTFNEQKTMEIPVNLTQQELAAMTASSPASIKKTYQSLKAQGILNKQSGTYHLKFKDLLES